MLILSNLTPAETVVEFCRDMERWDTELKPIERMVAGEFGIGSPQISLCEVKGVVHIRIDGEFIHGVTKAEQLLQFRDAITNQEVMCEVYLTSPYTEKENE